MASPAPLWKTAAIFLGFLWVVALFEEFIFRGVLQQWLEEWITEIHDDVLNLPGECRFLNQGADQVMKFLTARQVRDPNSRVLIERL